MASVTAFTAERSQQIEDQAIVGGAVVGDDLILTRHNGDTINAGNVRGIMGPPGAEDVKMHGALGDDVQDDVTFIQAALDAAEALGGGLVYMPIGVYKTTLPIEVPPNVTLFGAGESTIIHYTGVGTALRAKYFATVSQKKYMRVRDFKITCTTAAIGIDATAWFKCEITRVHVTGNTVAPVVGSIGILFDGRYGYAIGCWYNTVDHGDVEGFTYDIKLTGIPGSGQANENTIRKTRIASYTTYGVWIDSANHVMIDDCDLTCAIVGSLGVYNNDIDNQIKPCRFENNDYGIRCGPLSKRTHIWPQLFSDVLVAIQIDAGALDTYVYDGGLFTGVTTLYIDAGTQTRVNHTRMSGASLIPLSFTKAAVPANQTSQVMVPNGEVATNYLRYIGCHYQIRAIAIRSDTPFTAGTMTVKPTIGLVESAVLAAVMGSGAPSVNSGESWQGIGKDTNNGTSGVGAKYTTTADLAPLTANVSVIVYVELVRTIT